MNKKSYLISLYMPNSESIPERFVFCFLILFLFDLILYFPANNLSVISDGSSWFELVLSKD